MVTRQVQFSGSGVFGDRCCVKLMIFMHSLHGVVMRPV